MNTEQAINILRRLRPSLAARGIAHAGVFGSVACGENGAGKITLSRARVEKRGGSDAF